MNYYVFISYMAKISTFNFINLLTWYMGYNIPQWKLITIFSVKYFRSSKILSGVHGPSKLKLGGAFEI